MDQNYQLAWWPGQGPGWRRGGAVTRDPSQIWLVKSRERMPSGSPLGELHQKCEARPGKNGRKFRYQSSLAPVIQNTKSSGKATPAQSTPGGFPYSVGHAPPSLSYRGPFRVGRQSPDWQATASPPSPSRAAQAQIPGDRAHSGGTLEACPPLAPAPNQGRHLIESCHLGR